MVFGWRGDAQGQVGADEVIGSLIFADIPLALVPDSDINWGWDDQCPSKNNWAQLPANDDQWSAQLRAENVWRGPPAAQTDWKPVEKSTSAWEKQETRVEDHNKC